MAKAYMKFEMDKDLADKVQEAVAIANATGKIRRGVNESTKAIERGIAKLVVMADDVEPEEVLMHIPVICEEKQVPYAYGGTKMDLGKASGIDVPTSSIAITEEGDAKKLVAEISKKTAELKKGE